MVVTPSFLYESITAETLFADQRDPQTLTH
jgi:hypothetical protein